MLACITPPTTTSFLCKKRSFHSIWGNSCKCGNSLGYKTKQKLFFSWNFSLLPAGPLLLQKCPSALLGFVPPLFLSSPSASSSLNLTSVALNAFPFMEVPTVTPNPASPRKRLDRLLFHLRRALAQILNLNLASSLPVELSSGGGSELCLFLG